jgi:hypothetical protein
MSSMHRAQRVRDQIVHRVAQQLGRGRAEQLGGTSAHVDELSIATRHEHRPWRGVEQRPGGVLATHGGMSRMRPGATTSTQRAHLVPSSGSGKTELVAAMNHVVNIAAGGLRLSGCGHRRAGAPLNEVEGS